MAEKNNEHGSSAHPPLAAHCLRRHHSQTMETNHSPPKPNLWRRRRRRRRWRQGMRWQEQRVQRQRLRRRKCEEGPRQSAAETASAAGVAGVLLFFFRLYLWTSCRLLIPLNLRKAWENNRLLPMAAGAVSDGRTHPGDNCRRPSFESLCRLSATLHVCVFAPACHVLHSHCSCVCTRRPQSRNRPARTQSAGGLGRRARRGSGRCWRCARRCCDGSV